MKQSIGGMGSQIINQYINILCDQASKQASKQASDLANNQGFNLQSIKQSCVGVICWGRWWTVKCVVLECIVKVLCVSLILNFEELKLLICN